MGGGLKFEEKKSSKKTTKSTPKKKLGIGSTVLCTFHSPQPNNIDPAWQQTQDWGSPLHFSESGRGRWAHSYYLLALRLDYMEFAMGATTEWKMGREHTCHSLWTGDKCTHPKFPRFVWDWEGKQQCFFLPDQTTGDLKFYRRYNDLISKFQVGLKSLLRQGLSEPDFYGDLVYKLKKIVGSNNFSAQFIKIISHYKKIGYNINVLQQTACLVVNPITVGNFAFLFNCTPVGRTSDSMMVPT